MVLLFYCCCLVPGMYSCWHKAFMPTSSSWHVSFACVIAYLFLFLIFFSGLRAFCSLEPIPEFRINTISSAGLCRHLDFVEIASVSIIWIIPIMEFPCILIGRISDSVSWLMFFAVMCTLGSWWLMDCFLITAEVELCSYTKLAHCVLDFFCNVYIGTYPSWIIYIYIVSFADQLSSILHLV